MKLKIDKKGVITAIYDDRLVNLMALGKSTTERVSNVEPCYTPYSHYQGWQVKMNDGAYFGPYRLRQEALNAEVEYLEKKLGLKEDDPK